MNLEDTHLDVLTKAQKAQGMTDRDLAKLAQVSIPELNSIRSGGREPAALERLANALGLRSASVSDLATGSWHPPTVALPSGVAMFTTPFADMTVNHFLIWDPSSLKAVAVDAGTDADALLACLGRHKLTLVKILLTHAHGDHILELDRIREKTKAPAFAPESEPVEGCKPVKNGQSFKVGSLSIKAHTVPGHSVGGTVYEFHGLETPVAAVGDVMFAGSVGGIRSRYRQALESIRNHVLSMAQDTILLPGHGPLTTVSHEKAHNPFFP
ncbi:MAG: MBL fold metallo-hydrolase [Verrucomicrobia bacterium]|nr:MBL fold metallo-hydrolase [Verrucomicrobiota bacterium]